MLKPIRSILFATDLTPNCQQALDFTIAIATRFHATIYMLYVMEKLPDQMIGRARSILGTHQWKNMVASHHMEAHKSLVGKQFTDTKIRDDVRNFCIQEGIDNETCDFESREIIISDGEIIDDILKSAEANKCDLIVLGGHRNIFSQTSIGSTVKGVLKHSKIPVTVVPSSVS